MSKNYPRLGLSMIQPDRTEFDREFYAIRLFGKTPCGVSAATHLNRLIVSRPYTLVRTGTIDIKLGLDIRVSGNDPRFRLKSQHRKFSIDLRAVETYRILFLVPILRLDSQNEIISKGYSSLSRNNLLITTPYRLPISREDRNQHFRIVLRNPLQIHGGICPGFLIQCKDDILGKSIVRSLEFQRSEIACRFQFRLRLFRFFRSLRRQVRIRISTTAYKQDSRQRI